jgi:prolyl-tRNA editing enzyme YbaK/EbsC (Cys-tRNA(Pro) deacylase)
MTVYDRIVNLLKEYGINFECVKHVPVYTSLEAAKIRNLDLSTGLKALVFFADKTPILVVVPGDKKVNTNVLKKIFGFRDLRFASPKEVFNIIGIEIGAVPPMGRALGLNSYFDKSIENKGRIAFNAGLHTVSVYMNAGDLLKIEKPKFGEFAEDL